VTGEYTFAIFAVTAAALVISWLVSVYFVPYLGTVLLQEAASRRGEGTSRTSCSTRRSTRAFVRWWTGACATAGSPSALTVATLRARHRRHGPGAAAVLPRFEPAGDPGRPVVPEGSTYPAESRRSRALRGAPDEARRGDVTTWVGSGVPRFYLPLDQIFPQSNVSQLVVLP
jgi:multidrug efflux pump